MYRRATIRASITLTSATQLLSGCSMEAAEHACAASVEQAIVHGGGDPSEETLPERVADSVGALEDEDGRLRCTGVAIAANWVLSAAHCVGSGLTFRRADGGNPHVFAKLEDPLYHPKLDLALLRLRDAPTHVEAALRPLALGPDAALRVGATAVLGGVGLTEDGSDGSLTFVEERIAAIDGGSITVDGRGKSGACVGDSGGPLFADVSGSGRLALVGILSMGSRSCRSLDRYTRISAAKQWILQTIGTDARSSSCD